MTTCAPSGVASGSPAPRIVFIRFAHTASSSGASPMKLPITRATTGWATSLTRSQHSRPSRASSTALVIERIAGLVLGDALWREALLEQRLDAVVLGGIHADEHGLLELELEDRVLQRGEAADLRRVGLPVAAHLVDVVGRGDRPEAVLLGVLRDARGPVHRALRAKPLEQSYRRTLAEVDTVSDAELLQRRDLELDRRPVRRSRAGGAHRALPPFGSSHPHAKPTPRARA